jgi:hypothetical protein
LFGSGLNLNLKGPFPCQTFCEKPISENLFMAFSMPIDIVEAKLTN